MTIYAREIETIIHPKTTSSVETMPKGTRYITLLYHQVRVPTSALESWLIARCQCVLVATRPLLLSVLKERLDMLVDPAHREDDWRSFLAPTKALISTGIKSAIQTLQILTDEDSLLGKCICLNHQQKPWTDSDIQLHRGFSPIWDGSHIRGRPSPDYGKCFVPTLYFRL